jgi:sugar/nucleoside kinase (ribokinase family)
MSFPSLKSSRVRHADHPGTGSHGEPYTMQFDASIFGLIVADLIASPMNLRSPPAPGGLHLLNSISISTGGNVCNTGIAMARLGAKIAATGIVGNDTLGKAMLTTLQSEGLNTDKVLVDSRAQTSASIVAVEPGGERCFFHTPGVTPLLDATVFRQCFPTFAASAWLQIGYFGLLPTLTPDLAQVLAELKSFSPKTKIALDTVNPPAARELLPPILKHLDLFAPSRTEAQVLSGESNPKSMIAHFRRHMPTGIIAIKLDAEGCLLDDTHQSVLAPAYPVEVLDTTGAGDTWFGALLVALQRGMALPTAGKFANRAAADCCTALGASAGVQSFEQTLARL